MGRNLAILKTPGAIVRMGGVRRQRRHHHPQNEPVIKKLSIGRRRASLQEQEVSEAINNWGMPRVQPEPQHYQDNRYFRRSSSDNKREWTADNHNKHHHHKQYYRRSSSSSCSSRAASITEEQPDSRLLPSGGTKIHFLRLSSEGSGWHNFLDEFIPPVRNKCDGDSSESCSSSVDHHRAAENNCSRQHALNNHIMPGKKKDVQRKKRRSQRSRGEGLRRSLSDSDLNLRVYVGDEGGASSDGERSTSSSASSSSDDGSDEDAPHHRRDGHGHSFSSDGRAAIERGGEGSRSSSVPPNYYREVVQPPEQSPLAFYAEFLPEEPPSRSILFSSPSPRSNSWPPTLPLTTTWEQSRPRSSSLHPTPANTSSRTTTKEGIARQIWLEKASDRHIRFQIPEENEKRGVKDHDVEEEQQREEEQIYDNSHHEVMSTGESSSELDGSDRSESVGGGDDSSTIASSGTVSSGSRFELQSTSSSSHSSSVGGALKEINEKEARKSPSSYKELLKIAYGRRQSNPVDSDEDKSTGKLAVSPKSITPSLDEGIREGGNYESAEFNALPVKLSADESTVAADYAASTENSATSTEKNQNSFWSVAEGSSSTYTSDLNKVAIRRCRNEHEFNKAMRGEEASPNTTRLQQHIEKGRKKHVNSPKKKDDVQKKKAAVDVIFPSKGAYSRNSFSKGIKFRERFIYNWDDRLHDNAAFQEEKTLLSGAGDVAVGADPPVYAAANFETSAPQAVKKILGSNDDGVANNTTSSSAAEVYKRNDTISSFKTTVTMATADSTVFSGTSSPYSRQCSTPSQASSYTFSSMKSYLSQSQIRHLEYAPPELIDVLNQQLTILKTRRKDIVEKGSILHRTGSNINVDDSIQMKNSIQFSLFVMKDKVEQLQDIFGPLNAGVLEESVFSDSSSSDGPCSAATESSAEESARSSLNQ